MPQAKVLKTANAGVQADAHRSVCQSILFFILITGLVRALPTTPPRL